MKAQCMNFGARVVGFFISTKRPPLTVKHLFLHPQECGLWPVCPQAMGERGMSSGQGSSQRDGGAGGPDSRAVT